MSNTWPIYEYIRRRYYRELAPYGGELLSIGRVNYNQVDGTPTITTGFRCRIEKTTHRLTQPALSGTENYALFGDLDLIQPGDLLISQDSTSSTPISTFVSVSPVTEAVSIRMNRTGAIYNGQDALYTNIKFEFLTGTTFPGSPLERELNASLAVPSLKAVMWERDLVSDTHDSTGLIFKETDASPNVRWQIKEIEVISPLIILVLGEDRIS